MENNFKKFFIVALTTSIIISSIFGGVMGFVATKYFYHEGEIDQVLDSKKVIKVEEESSVIAAVEKTSPAVVSIIVSKDLPVLEKYYEDSDSNDFFSQFFGDDFGDFFRTPRYRQKGTEKQEIGGGTGFLISSDGYIVTNRHVVSDEDADYTVLMNDESKHEAKVLARDTITDLAILKIDGDDFPYAEIGDSSDLKVGQSVIAIGNALGEFRNTVSTGVISGLSRSITAGGYGTASEELSGVIQTDASINPGNSGGPLLNLDGQVIGINTAMANGAENIGFAIPINDVKNTIKNVKENGKIIRAWLGVRYIPITEDIKKANKLDVDYGALIIRGEDRTELAVIPGSPADKAGLVENDIILSVDGEELKDGNSLAKIISKHSPGDKVTLKILHKGDEKEVKVELEEMKD